MASTRPSAWRAIGEATAILEEVVPFVREISAIVARPREAATLSAFDIAENLHGNHILPTTRAPAPSAPSSPPRHWRRRARRRALDHVGVMAVEMFELARGPRLLVNEIAPRTHNSGHCTCGAAATSQFEQHVRAVAGWPLGDPRAPGDVTMTNLIGDDVARWREIAAEPGARLHLYGKSRCGRAGRWATSTGSGRANPSELF